MFYSKDLLQLVDDELLAICRQNSREALEALIQQRRATNPNYPPSLKLLLQAATITKADNIAAYCLENGQVAHRGVMTAVVANDSFAVYKLLVKYNAVDIDYYVPWYGDILGTFAYDNKLEWVKFCLENGADPNENLREEHMTALASAAATGNIEMVDLMLKHGARMKDSNAITEAALNGEFEMLKHLLSKGANIDEIGTKGLDDDSWPHRLGTPLHHAIRKGYTDMAFFLIDAGANINVKDPMGRTPEDLALEHNRTEILDALHQKMDAVKENSEGRISSD